MEKCEYCDEEFEGEEDLHIHWIEEHEDEINSHQKEKAKKAKRGREEREKVRKEQRKKYLFQGVGIAVLLAVAAIIVPQLIPSGNGSTGLDLEGEPMMGNSSANVTVVEFGDYQCPACNRFEQNTLPQLKENYIDTGEARFVWKDYPLSQIHDWAQPGAEAMECVYRQDEDAFWDVKTTLFNNQGSISLGDAQDHIIGWAEEERINSSEVRSCLQSGNPGSEVQSDQREGRANGVSGTPTIYVNGEQLNGFSYARVSQAIEEELEE
jgi:protein-disulfide isomerase